jgi:hypothetical protein
MLKSYDLPQDDPAASRVGILEAVRATSAGGIAFSNPISHIFEEAKILWPHLVGDAILVSIGPGKAPPPSLNYGDRVRVAELKAIATSSEKLNQDFLRHHSSMATSGRYFRFNVDHLPLDSEDHGESVVATLVSAYLEEQDMNFKFKRCVTVLAQTHSHPTSRTTQTERGLRNATQEQNLMLRDPTFQHP